MLKQNVRIASLTLAMTEKHDATKPVILPKSLGFPLGGSRHEVTDEGKGSP